MIIPPSISEVGYKDTNKDDHINNTYFENNQVRQMRIIEDRWVEGWSKNRTLEGAMKKA